MNSFFDRWCKISKERNSNICAGLDPSVYEMGRGEKGLPAGADKLKWSLDYIEAVAPYVSAIKPNAGSWGGAGDRISLKKVVDKIHEMGLIAIIDAKIADLGFTNDSWIYDYKNLGFDVVTTAPYAGNIESVVKFAKQRDIAIISMGLMSNPEYKTEMNFVSTVGYTTNSGQIPAGTTLWESRVIRSLDAGIDGLAVGGTYTKNDKEFMRFIEMTKDYDVVYLIPGIGAQGGQIEDFLASGIDPKKCIINSGRAIMFPNGSNSTTKEQANAAKKLRDEFNKVKNSI